jgi:hypothetical protein
MQQIEIEGQKHDFEAFRQRVKDNITQLPPRERAKQHNWMYEFDAAFTRAEKMLLDLDLHKDLGPLFEAVVMPMMRSKTKEFDLLQSLSNHFKKVRGDFGATWRKKLDDLIPNDFITDPSTLDIDAQGKPVLGSGRPYELTRQNLINIMLNWGNRSNIEKFVRAHVQLELGRRATRDEMIAYEARVKGLIDQHATAEDWKFVQAMWEPFRKLQPEADRVAQNVSGVVPKWIEATPVDTPHGQFDGGYWPVKYDQISGRHHAEPGAGQLFGPNFFRAATSKQYLKERTGYVDYIDIDQSIERAAGVLQQTIHDIAFRDALVQTNKILKDNAIRGWIKNHYGVEYMTALDDWIMRVANKNTTDSAAMGRVNRLLRGARTNLISHALGLSLRVIGSPDVGIPNPITWGKFEANRAANVKLAMEKSNEIRHMVYNMDRDFREQMERISVQNNWSTFQRRAAEWAFKPMMKISQEFRMATFVDEFNKGKAKGMTDGQAAAVADSHVRNRHGAASVVDLPAVMDQGEMGKFITMFYGYGSTMYNWMRDVPGQARRGEYKNLGATVMGTLVVGAAFNALLFTRSKKDDSWFEHISKAVLSMPLSTVPMARDAGALFIEGHESRTPLGSIGGSVKALVNDAHKVYTGKKVDKPISHTANVIGMTTGMPLGQIGRTGQFAYDVNKGKQKPKNIIEWMKGIIHGEIWAKR